MTRFLIIFKSIPQYFLLSVLCGILVGTSYIPFKGWALLFCYIPLWIATLGLISDKHSLKKVFFAGWVSQFILTLIGFNWIYYVASEFGHLHWSLSLGALLLYAGLMHVYIPISLLVGVMVIRRFNIVKVPVQFVILALLLALLERVWPSIFEWNLAYTLLWIRFPLYQWADSVGFWGLSTWLLLFQAGLAYAYTEFRTNRTKSVLVGLSVLIVIAALAALGAYKGKQWSHNDETIRIGVAQGNIGNAEKIQSEKKSQYHSFIRSIYSELTSQQLAAQPTDIMIWPETAMPFGLDDYFHERIEQKSLIATVRKWEIPVITGGYSVDRVKRDHLGFSMIRNAVFYFSPEGKFSDQPYFKTNLLAFGEYLPFGEQFPVLYKFFPFVGVFQQGSGPAVATIPYKNKLIRMGPQICYDSLYPGFSRGLAKNGAQIIFNVTNDSWYGWWAEPYQHQIMTLARAIEVRRPLIRSTNTGISSAILADGTLLENSPIDKSWAHTYSIPYKQNPENSFYTKFGYLDWLIWLPLLPGLIFMYKNKGDHV